MIEKDKKKIDYKELSEIPNGDSLKIKYFPLKKIFIYAFIISVITIALSYNSFQRKALRENLKWNEIKKQNEDFNKKFDPKLWSSAFNLRINYKIKFERIVLDYLYSLPLSSEDKKILGSNIYPVIFQESQRRYVELKNEYLDYVEPDLTQITEKNRETYKYLNEQGKKEIDYWLPIWNFIFEKASNAKSVEKIYIALLREDLSDDKKLEVCEILKNEVKDFKGIFLDCVI